MKMIKFVMIVLCIEHSILAAIQINSISVEAHVKNGSQVHLEIKCSNMKNADTITVYRSYINIGAMKALDLENWPITKTKIAGKSFTGTIIDSFTAHNVEYSYYLKVRFSDGLVASSNVVTASIPDVVVIPNSQPLTIFVDKLNYFLEIRFGNFCEKRFPVNFGRNPQGRKTYFDCMSTPEGSYHIAYLKPVSAFHKAIGVSYPNNADRIRYKNALLEKKVPLNDGKPVSIGGSIQIHGGGTGNNWTWGCVAMRNDDLDQIFVLPQLRRGILITIVGNEFTRDSVLVKDPMQL
jgi:hypothetical protein